MVPLPPPPPYLLQRVSFSSHYWNPWEPLFIAVFFDLLRASVCRTLSFAHCPSTSFPPIFFLSHVALPRPQSLASRAVFPLVRRSLQARSLFLRFFLPVSFLYIVCFLFGRYPLLRPKISREIREYLCLGFEFLEFSWETVWLEERNLKRVW